MANQRAALAAAARGGDPVARMALHDLAEEAGYQPGTHDPTTPYVVGECYLIQTTTLYYVGRITRQGIGWVELGDASWVHRTGRLSTTLANGLDCERPRAEYRPVTERCPLPVIIHVGTQGVIAHPWPHPLPQRNITS